VLLGATLVVLLILGWIYQVPPFIRKLPPAVVWVPIIAFCWAAFFIAGRKGYYINMQSDHPWVRLDARVQAVLRKIGKPFRSMILRVVPKSQEKPEKPVPATKQKQLAKKEQAVEHYFDQRRQHDIKSMLKWLPVIVFLSGLVIAGSGYLFYMTLPAASINTITPFQVSLYLYGVAAAVIALSVGLYIKKISLMTAWIVSALLFFVAIGPLILFVKDNVDQGSWVPWLLLIAANFCHLAGTMSLWLTDEGI
jgi:hypothetical protein